MVTTMNGNDNDNHNHNVDNLAITIQKKQNEHPAEATTMTDKSNILHEDESSKNVQTKADEKNAGEKCIIEVFPEELVDRLPPVYSLTSPCLPPKSPREEDWPPEPPPPFDGHPPYPAGPPLLKVAYPKDIPGPTYACPNCEGKFLYHRPAGIVLCPFCHSAISIGHYVRIRAWSLIMFGLLVFLSSITFALANILFLQSSMTYFIAIGFMAAFALILLFRAAHICSYYQETERIDFS